MEAARSKSESASVNTKMFRAENLQTCQIIQGVFFSTGPLPEKLNYGKQRLGEVRSI